MYYLVETKYIGVDFVKNPHSVLITNKPILSMYKKEVFIERDNKPSIATRGSDVVINGLIGIGDEYEYYAHGEFQSIQEAVNTAKKLFGDLREVESDDYDTDIIKEFFVGKYEYFDEQTAYDYCYYALTQNVSVDMTDTEIKKLAASIEADANYEGYTGSEFWEKLIIDYKNSL